MKHLLLTLALLAPLALAACDNNADTTTSSIDNPSAMEPAAGDAAMTETTTETTTTETTVTPAEPVVAPATTEGVAVGEPNPATPADANSCGDHSAWVGKKQADIQSEIDAMGEKVRVLGPDSAATMDYNAERVNVVVDAEGNVTEVRCG